MSAVFKPESIGKRVGAGLQSARKIFNAWPFALGLAGVAALLAFYRLYQGAYAFKYGLDSMTPEFEKYWVTMFLIEIPVIFGLGLLVVAYLWFTRDKKSRQDQSRDRTSPQFHHDWLVCTLYVCFSRNYQLLR